MDINKSLDEVELIAALLHDVQNDHGVVFNIRACNLTCKKVKKRVSLEGISFLTKTLPRLGKAFDKALLAIDKFDCKTLGFKPYRDTVLPSFLGELFSLVFAPDGAVLPEPCVQSIKQIRMILYCFYKYKLPYSHEQEQQVLSAFEKTEEDIHQVQPILSKLLGSIRQVDISVSALLPEEGIEMERDTGDQTNYASPKRRDTVCESHQANVYSKRLKKGPYEETDLESIARSAKVLLSNLFSTFDPTDIVPKHGPGAVATKQQLDAKFRWTNISKSITDKYPIDAYFYASLGHFCDEYRNLSGIGEVSLPARVILVPKDSRGPRLISAEPVDFQWIQQGLSKAIVELVERHPLTKWNVRFTDQLPNRFGALVGSKQGRYSTLDLKEASDRVSVGLVRLLFPSHIFEYLMACRSSCTRLPDGRVIELDKFAPMGSALCFPILALTIWSLLSAGVEDTDARESIYVYGDDVIVPTASAENAIKRLESFGLKVNRDKSCTSGFFRESCGLDAYKGVEVTPVRFKTVWSSSRRPDVYTSWIAYANQLYDRHCYHAYDYIVGCLHHVYGAIPDDDMLLSCPSLREVPLEQRPNRRRVNKSLQKLEYLVYDVRSPSVNRNMNGWSMLLRYFTEGARSASSCTDDNVGSTNNIRSFVDLSSHEEVEPFSVRLYTRRRASLLVRRWR